MLVDRDEYWRRFDERKAMELMGIEFGPHNDVLYAVPPDQES